MYSFIKIGVVVLLGVMLELEPFGSRFVEARRRRSMLDDNKYGLSSEDNDNFDTSRYKFAYGVEDHKTGDFKMHQEERDGDLVKGEYTVADADGSLRTVRYTADKYNGFHAVISKAGDPRQEYIPAPAATNTYHRAIKVPTAPASNHYYNHREQEGVRYTDTSASPSTPVRKYIQELPQFAKYHAARHNKVVENYADENAAHYQTININNNKEQTHYSYKVSQAEKEKQELKKPSPSAAPSRHWEFQQQQLPVFSLQTPQGFRKSEDVLPPAALPLIGHNQNGQNGNYNVNEEEDENDGNGGGAPTAEAPDWKQYDPQGRNERQLNNYKHIFETHFGRLRRPGNDQGAYSYMNFEGETTNGYELQHNQNNIQRKKSINARSS